MEPGQGTTEVVAESVEKTTIFMQPQPVTVMIEHQSAGAIVDVSDLIWWGGLWLTSVSVMLVIMSGFAAIWVWLFGKSYFKWKEETTAQVTEIAKKVGEEAGREAGLEEVTKWYDLKNNEDPDWPLDYDLKNNENPDWPLENKGERND